MRERDIEAYGVKKIQKAGAYCIKFTSPGRRSVPDRLVLWDCGTAEFIEFKAPGAKPTPLQEREHERLRAHKFNVDVIDSKSGVDTWLSERGYE